MASLALVSEFLGNHLFQSGHRPGATESTNAPNAMPFCQSDVKFDIDKVGILCCIHTSSLELRDVAAYVYIYYKIREKHFLDRRRFTCGVVFGFYRH